MTGKLTGQPVERSDSLRYHEGEVEPLIARAARDLLDASYAIALTGAGMSTESGIPDFRGPSGIWTKDPAAERRAYQSYDRFVLDPASWWKERLAARGTGHGWADAEPNAGHYALAELEDLGIIKAVLTQNVDGLHVKAGSKQVLEYHGSILKLRCTSCGSRLPIDDFDLDELAQQGELPPRCPGCGGALKTDVVEFGEPIPSDVAMLSVDEARQCDLMLICGTSAVVYPFAALPALARERAGVTIIEVNAQPTPLTQQGISDYLIRGQTGEVLPAIVSHVYDHRRER